MYNNTDGLVALQAEFWTRIYIPLGIWMLFIVALMIAMSLKYPFGKNWTKDNPNPYETETFGLPRGMFRAILTLTLLFGTLLFEMANLYSGNDESNIIQWLTAFQMMIAFYFGSKVMHHITSADHKKAVKRAEAEKAVASSEFGAAAGVMDQSQAFANESDGFDDVEGAG